MAFNYGARQEIARAARRIADEVALGQLEPDDITADTIGGCLDAPDLPDPDLIIRTSGEQRLSNFLLWQAAYSELVFVPTNWPDFDRAALEAAITRISAARAALRRPRRQDRILTVAEPEPAVDPRSSPGDGGTTGESHRSGMRTISCCVLLRPLVLAPLALGAAWLGGWPFALFWGRRRSPCCGNGRRWWPASIPADVVVLRRRVGGRTLVAWRDRPIGGDLRGRPRRACRHDFCAARAAALDHRRHRLCRRLAAGAAAAARRATWLGFIAIVLLFAIVWTTDIFGYFAGRAFGGPKLMPAVSPNKTWSGAIAGALGAMIVAVLVDRVRSATFNKLAIAVRRAGAVGGRRKPAISSNPGSSAGSAPRMRATSFPAMAA